MRQTRVHLTEALVDAAEAAILRDGFAALRARGVTEAAGCALGALYTVFPDMDALILAVKARILDRLDARLIAALGEPRPEGQEGGTALLVAMAQSYLAFAWDERRAWEALFQHQLADGQDLPDWYRARLAAIFSHVAVPLRAIFPAWPETEGTRVARLLFSAVHGIVVLGLEQKLERLSREQIQGQIEMLLSFVTAGLEQRPTIASAPPG